MGEDPGNGSYVVGAACEDCDAGLFPDGTPKYILLSVSGISVCAPWPIEPPNGSWLLEQQPGQPCSWGLVDDPYTFQANLGTFWGCIIDDFATSREYFTDLVGGPCEDFFSNDFTDCLLGPISINGIAKMSWGPSIHP